MKRTGAVFIMFVAAVSLCFPEPGSAIIPVNMLSSDAIRIFPRGVSPVTRQGKPLAVVFDFDGNGYTDVCVLGAVVDEKSKSDVIFLSDFSRLFKKPYEAVPFSVELFLQDKGKLVHSASIPLPGKYVFDSMSLLPLSDNGSYPTAVAVEFLNEQGSETELVVFTGQGPFSRFTMFDTPNRRTHAGDIDKDGIQDFLLEERTVEAGTGYETFLVWYRWTEDQYKEQASVNVVRNLRSFLQKAKTMLVSRSRQDFLLFALPDESASEIRNSRTPEVLLAKIFTPATFPNGGERLSAVANPMLSDRRIIDVVFPDVTECPFPLDTAQGYTFSLPLRVRFEGNEDFYFYSTIRLSRNPFSGKQYTFLPR